MYNENPKMVEIIFFKDSYSFKFKCRACGQEWLPSQKPKKPDEVFSDSDLFKSSWQCPNGCKAEDVKE